MNWKHILWIIPLSLIIGLIIGNEIFLWDCYDGCIYAEWVQYGYKNLSTSSELYNKCAEACWYGENVFK